MNPSDTNLADNSLIHMDTIMALRGARNYACHNTTCESYVTSVEPAHNDPPQYTAAVREKFLFHFSVLS